MATMLELLKARSERLCEEAADLSKHVQGSPAAAKALQDAAAAAFLVNLAEAVDAGDFKL